MSALRAASHAFLLTWQSIFRDKAALLLFFISGIVYSFFYPLPYSAETVRRVPVAIVDQDHSALSRQLIRYAGAHSAILVVAVSTRPEAAQKLIWQGQAAGAMIIPADFSRKVLAGLQPEIDISGHGAYPLLNKVVLNGLAEVAGTVSAGIELKRLSAMTPSGTQAEASRQPLGVEALPLFNVREGYASYIVPGVVVLIMQQTFLLGIGLLFGSWSSEKSFPYAQDAASYCGALTAFALVVALNAMYFFGFVFWWQDYPRGGNLAGTAMLTLLFAYSVAALGMLIGMFFRTRERSMQLLVATSLPIMFLSGLTWPASAIPAPLQVLGWLLPSTAAIQGFVATNQMGASLHEVRMELAGLLGLATVFVVLGLRKWRRIVPPR
ncbi:ABC transporter permease [Massilia yuzhufengensis]|uniref:ABC-2 type transport system permease protein n=1 Tax=Massilia yuzhufengensis TaxID=1164594 RepID=A0A1I1VFC9_9BURK|nr:ABC transporter permease [Massilia yuzhufengensis]SFD81707.1 ABC-2 type transport system permease protein [Massilia yuzhufengensis]